MPGIVARTHYQWLAGQIAILGDYEPNFFFQSGSAPGKGMAVAS